MRIQLFIILFIFSVLNSCGQDIEVCSPLFPCSKKLDNPYGITSHFDSPSRDYINQSGQLKLMSQAGIGNIRMGIPMNFMADYVNAKSNLYIDTALNRNQEYKIEELIVTRCGSYSSGWAWDNLDLYSKAFKYYLNKYGKQVKQWEIINEFNLKKNINKDSLPYRYMSILPLAYSMIKKHNKHNFVVLSGIGGNFKKQLDFSRKLYSLSACDFFDVFNFHTYSEPENIDTELKAFASLMKEYGKMKPVWITECGMSTYSKIREQSDKSLEIEQAKRLARIFLISFSYGVDKVFFYYLRSNPRNKGVEREFGLVSGDLIPKPAYTAYSALTKMCPSGSLRPKLCSLGTFYLAEWRKPDKTNVWAVWNATGISRKQDVEIIGKARYFDYLGREMSNISEIDDRVVYIVGAKSVRIKQSSGLLGN